MMVRAVFSVLVTVGLLAGAMLWHSGPPEADAPVEGEPMPLAQRALEVAADVAAEVEAIKRDAAPVIEQAAAVANAVARASQPAPQGDAPAEPAVKPAVKPPGKPAGEPELIELAVIEEPEIAEPEIDAFEADEVESAAQESGVPATEELVVEEARLDAYDDLPFLEGPPDADAEPAAIEVAATQAPGEVTAPPPDQEEWAGLIRRMLAIYERVGPAQ